MLPAHVRPFAAAGLVAVLLLAGAVAAQAQTSSPPTSNTPSTHDTLCATKWDSSFASNACNDTDRTTVTGTGTDLGGTTSCTVDTYCPVLTPNDPGPGTTQTWNATSYTGPPSEIQRLCNSVTTPEDGSTPLSTGTLVLCP